VRSFDFASKGLDKGRGAERFLFDGKLNAVHTYCAPLSVMKEFQACASGYGQRVRKKWQWTEEIPES